MIVKPYLLPLFTVLLISGCGGAKGPDVQFVEGVVNFDGKPLSKALVVFHPKDGTSLAASGFTDDNGTFRLTSLRGGKNNGGAALGEYIVTFTRDKDEPTSYREVQEAGGMERVPVYESLIPVRYIDPKTSGVSAVVEKKKNRFEFTLENK